MAILDKHLMLSYDQAIVATAPSTDALDLMAVRMIGQGEPLVPYVRVTQAFNNLTSLKIEVQKGEAVDANGDPTFADAATVVEKTVLLAGLGLNTYIPMPALPAGVKASGLRFNYTVTGAAPTTGKVRAGFARPKDLPAAYQGVGVTM